MSYTLLNCHFSINSSLGFVTTFLGKKVLSSYQGSFLNMLLILKPSCNVNQEMVRKSELYHLMRIAKKIRSLGNCKGHRVVVICANKGVYVCV